MWHDLFTRMTWLIDMCDMTHLCVWSASSDVYSVSVNEYESRHMCPSILPHVERGMSHMSMSHVTHVNKSDSSLVTWVIDICDMTHWHMWHDSLTYVTWLIDICDMTHLHMWHDSLTYVTWLIYICDMTNWLMWHDSFTYVTWLIDICDMTHLHMWHDSLTYVTWLIYMCQSIMPHVEMSHVTRVTSQCVCAVDLVSHVTHVNESCHTCGGGLSHV